MGRSDKKVDNSNVRIIEYEKKYIKDVRNLLVAQEQEISSMDKDELDRVHPDYRIKYTALELADMRKNNGKCYLAVESGEVIGLVLGVIHRYDKYDYLDYKCPKRGRVLEIIVNKKARRRGIGNMLMNHLENYFKSQDCEYIIIEVLSYNKIAKAFYNYNNYHERTEVQIKKI